MIFLKIIMIIRWWCQVSTQFEKSVSQVINWIMKPQVGVKICETRNDLEYRSVQ